MNQTSQYDVIAKKYQQGIAHEKYIVYLCDPSVLNAIGDPKGLKIVDFGCGEGYFSRILKAMGAEKVVGFDISQGMIDLAKQAENGQPLGISYMHADARVLSVIDEFDIILARFVFHYSKTEEEMRQMIDSAYRNLKKGGRLIALLPQYGDYVPKDSKYGYMAEIKRPLNDGDTIKITLYPENKPSFSFENFYWSPGTYKQVAEAAGFKNIKWIPVEVSGEGIEKYGQEFWKDYLDNPTLVILEAIK